MTSVREIRSRITSIQNTKKITKAMEMVSASKMRKSKNRVIASRLYIDTIRKIVSRFASVNLEYKHFYFEERNVRRVHYLVISTNRGLCASLNTSLFKRLLIDIMTWSDRGVNCELTIVGSKGISFFSSMNVNIALKIVGEEDSFVLYEKLTQSAEKMLQAFNKGDLDKLYIVNNKFIDTLSQIPTISQLLPLSPFDGELECKLWDYLYEPNPKILLNALLYRYIKSHIYQSVIENLVSEQAARMIAMKTATDNSESLIKELQLICNKARQTGITQELVEIISGIAAII